VENFGIFLQQAPIGALLVDVEQRIISINEKGRQIFQIGDDRIYTLQDLLPAVATGFQPFLRQPGKIVSVGERYFELHASEVKNESGQTLHILLVSDITEQKQREAALMESEALFRFMAEAMPQKVWTADHMGRRTFFNQNWIDYTGLPLEQLAGWGWTQVIHPDDLEDNIRCWKESIATGADFQFEHRIRRHDGAYRWHLVRGVGRKNASGQIQLWVGTNTDIHEQKAFAEELERRVEERTIELQHSNAELQQFVYVTSHDLQEPLRKIRIFSDLLQSNAASLDETSKRHVEKINNTALRMSTLLTELLNFTQISREESFVPTDLNAIVAKVLVDLEMVIQQKQAEINVGELPVIDAVPIQMQQLFYNLLNNALKFSKADVKPYVQVTACVADPQSLKTYFPLHNSTAYYEIIVADNGIGFDQHHADQIFAIFQRLHGRNEYQGTGIGLALCKKAVANHGGVIFARSEKGSGSSFHLLLPVRRKR
jgi:two-component system CheB/CheR fusion protein